MKNILLVIDMQNDFVFGPLSTDQAREIVQNVKEKVLNFKGDIYFTRDTHFENYLSSQEGKTSCCQLYKGHRRLANYWGFGPVEKNWTDR